MSDIWMLSRKLSESMSWMEWMDKIPNMEIPEGFKIKVIPPFSGAMVRFRLIYKDRNFSVYLDCHEILGFFGEPYWEVHPINEDCFRCAMDDYVQIFDAIRSEVDDETTKSS